jgi:hypothetical protein
MDIGVPRERRSDESRVGLTPAGVELLSAEGHNCYVESGAGLGPDRCGAPPVLRRTGKSGLRAQVPVMASATGLCGMVFLMGGDVPQIEAQINNMVGTMAGIICDGAKSGWSLRDLMAIGLAVDTSYLSTENVQIPAKDGIIGKDVMGTLRNLQKTRKAE